MVLESRFEYNLDLKNEYKFKFLEDNSDYVALHQYILCLLLGSQFVDSNGNLDAHLIGELGVYLEAVAQSDQAEPYEALFYYELNRALGNEDAIDSWLKKFPNYMEYCKLSVLSCDFLMHIGLYDAAEVCCQDIYNTSLINPGEYVRRYSEMLYQKGNRQELFDFLVKTIVEGRFFSPPFVFSKTVELAEELNKQDEVLELFRRGVAENAHIKWISGDYIKLCLDKGLNDEAQIEYERFMNVVKHIYSNTSVGKNTQNLFKYFCFVRKLMGLQADKNTVAEELGIQLKNANKEDSSSPSIHRWLRAALNRGGGKPLLKKTSKISKPFGTYFKLFATNGKEIIHAKSIFGNYISVVCGRFKSLFGTNNFEVTDYSTFCEAFPFYSFNGFDEEEIDEVSDLLTRIRNSCIQLNPFVTRSFPMGEMLADTLSVNTKIATKDEMLEYEVFDRNQAQITVFGAALLICTFLTPSEKEAFVFEMAETDGRLTGEALKQVFGTIPPTTIFVETNTDLSEGGREKSIFSLLIRQVLFRFLLDFENQILTEYKLLDTDRPNSNCKHFDHLLEMKYTPDSDIYINVQKLRNLAISGLNLGEINEGEEFTIRNIVKLMAECCDKDNTSKIFQNSLEALFTASVNRKYYNQMKWGSGQTEGRFLNNLDRHCKKILFKNEELMTEDDEYALYNSTKRRLFTDIDDVQSREFFLLFNTESFEWKQIVINIYKVDSKNCTVLINGQEKLGEYFIARPEDNVEIIGINGHHFVGWSEAVCFESPLAKHIIHEAKLIGG